MKRIVSATLFLGLFLVFTSSPAVADTSTIRSLNYEVYLDGKKIGYHRFEIDETGNKTSVRSEASFDVKFLFITAFRYRHQTVEQWNEGCLKRIESRTNSNGKRLDVSGVSTDEGFIVETGDSEAQLPDCVMTFAYWNPVFLNEPRLLNPQTGEYLVVDVEDLGSDRVELDGREVPARSVRLTAREMDITLWYSSESEWLALESVAKGGRVIRYELS